MYGLGSRSSKSASRTRLCFPHSSVLGSVKVGSYKFTELNMSNVTLKTVSSEEEYLEGCGDPEHLDCMGHLCENPVGMILYPGSMCTVVGDVKDKFFECSEAHITSRFIDQRKVDEYHSGLQSLLMSKDGIIRGKCCSGFIEGSLRMVILPSWELSKREVFLPQYVKTTFIAPTRTNKSRLTPVFREGKMDEGDWVILLRPPTLWEGNAQPMRVRFWNRTAIGICPELCNDYHADFDGDEMMLYHISHPDSIKECESWKMQSREMFDFNEIEKWIPEGTKDVRRTFMESTSITLREAMDDIDVTYPMKVSKVKKDSFSMLKTMMDNIDDDEYFIMETVRGTRDIMVQQLNQGKVGKILRMARVASQDFVSMGNLGSLHISGNLRFPDLSLARAGLPGARLTSKIGALVQQEFLDAHRAKSQISKGYNLAISFIEGLEDTIVLTDRKVPSAWTAKISEKRYLCHVRLKSFSAYSHVIGSYSSKILSMISEDRRRECATRGVIFLVKYCKILTSPEEVSCLVEMIITKCSRAYMQPTTGIGMGSRNFRWLSKVVCQHWKKLKNYKEELDTEYRVSTVVESCIFGNFGNLPGVLDSIKHGDEFL